MHLLPLGFDLRVGTPVAVRAAGAVRGAAVIARQVLEQTVERRCRELAGDTDRASARSKLILVSELADPVFSTAAQTAWYGLSRACHHHSYELTPGFAEIRALTGLVRSLIEEW